MVVFAFDLVAMKRAGWDVMGTGDVIRFCCYAILKANG